MEKIGTDAERKAEITNKDHSTTLGLRNQFVKNTLIFIIYDNLGIAVTKEDCLCFVLYSNGLLVRER